MKCYKCSYNSVCGGSDFFMDCDIYSPIPVCQCGCTMDEVTLGKNIDTDRYTLLFTCPDCEDKFKYMEL